MNNRYVSVLSGEAVIHRTFNKACSRVSRGGSVYTISAKIIREQLNQKGGLKTAFTTFLNQFEPSRIYEET